MSRLHKLSKDRRNGNWYVWIRRDELSKYFNFGRNKKQAQEKLRKLECDLESGKVQFSSLNTSQTTASNGKNDMRIEELAHHHLKWVEENLSASTFRLRQYYVKQFLAFIGGVMVSEITHLRLQEFYTEAKQSEKERVIKKASKSKKQPNERPNAGYEAMRNVRTFLRWGEEVEVIELPFKRFPKLSYTQPETRQVEEDELKTLILHAAPDFKDLIIFGVLTGLRPIELRNLRQEHIHHDQQGTPYIFIEKDVKAAKRTRSPKPRSVPLPKEAEAIVERQIIAHPQSPIIFLNEDGKPYTRYTLRDRFRRLAKDCGLTTKVIPYGLRHTFASLQAVGGTETTSLAQLMGHSTTRTLQRYVSNTVKHHKEAMDRTENRIMALLNSGNESNVQQAETGKKLLPNLLPNNPEESDKNPRLS